ncbi:MAG: hypothetical protein GF331_06140 [Chitinivibrionales bacterium]|nr:hypothetical protein [Chitinivibrionales bacterium]
MIHRTSGRLPKASPRGTREKRDRRRATTRGAPMADWADTIISEMSLEQKVGQCVVVGMSGTMVTNDLREAITRHHCGGIRLSPFTRIFRYFSDSRARKADMGEGYMPSLQKIMRQGPSPYVTPEQLAEMLNGLRDLAAQRNPRIPLHMVIDQEGDTSRDFAAGGVVQYPSNLGIAASGRPELAYEVARGIGRQMRALGLNMIHSPVVDVNTNPDNPEIGRRSFGDDPAVVTEYALAMLEGFREEGIIAAAKHFPGRGDSATDAHFACPTLDVDRKRMDAVEFYPYRRLIEAGIDSIMIAHCMYPQLDPDVISTVSRAIVTGLLREELGFEGVITTDSITMGALIDRYGVGEACARSLAAGVDIVLMKAENQWRGEMFHTITQWVKQGRIPMDELDAKLRRILTLKKRCGLFDSDGRVDPAKAREPQRDPVVVETARTAARHAILVPRDDLHALPLNPSRRVLLVNQQNSIKSPNDPDDHPALFAQLMEQELPRLQTYETEFGFNHDEEKMVPAFVENGNYDLILCTNFYDRSKKPHTYARTLIEQGYPVVLITNTPYCIKGLGGMIPEAPTIVLNMNLTPEGLRAVRDVLFGRLQPRGTWPLRNYDPLSVAVPV